MKDIGYYIYHNCKEKKCSYFPRYYKFLGLYSDCPICEGCKTYEKALKNETE